MRKKIKLASSGISFVDETWGGFYTCSTYLLVGPRKSGKTLLGLQFAQEAVKNQQTVCIYFTNMRPKDLMVNGVAINFDLQQYMDQNQIIVIRTNLPEDKDLNSDPDKYLQGYLQDIISVVEQYQPGKIIFDELTPFVGYTDINKLKEVFLQMCEAIEDMGVTSLFILGEPVSKQSKDIIDLLKENSTGLIQLRKKNDEEIFNTGEIIITPNIGHTEGQFRTEYRIQPKKGLVTDFILQTSPIEIAKSPKKKNPDKYKSLSEIEIIPENYPVTSFYNENEFRLILNNQIAYYKSTEQIFYVCSIFLNEEDNDGLFNINQLKNIVKLSADKKDKICIAKDRIIVLIINEDQKKVNNLIARIKNNLPGDDKEKQKKIIQSISIFTFQIDEKINNADDVFTKIFSDRVEEKY